MVGTSEGDGKETGRKGTEEEGVTGEGEEGLDGEGTGRESRKGRRVEGKGREISPHCHFLKSAPMMERQGVRGFPARGPRSTCDSRKHPYAAL